MPANAIYLRVQLTNNEVFGLTNSTGKAQDESGDGMAVPKEEPSGYGPLEQGLNGMPLLAHVNCEMLRQRKGKIGETFLSSTGD